MVEPMTLQSIASSLALSAQGEATCKISGLAIDSRAVQPGDLFAAISGAKVDGHDFLAQAAECGAVAALVTRDTESSLPRIVVDDMYAALQCVAAMARADYDGVLVGITGSAGKTSCKNLLAAIFEQGGSVLATEGNQNNELGVPLTLARLSASTEFAVLEMGAGKPGDIAWLNAMVRPTVAVLLNVAGAHIEHFGSNDAIADTKGAILDHLRANDLAVINGDDRFASRWRERTKSARVVTFGRSDQNDYRASSITHHNFKGSDFTLEGPYGHHRIRTALPGMPGIYNCLAAASVACELGFSLSAVAKGLAHVAPAAGRGQVTPMANGSVLVDDSYNANPAAVKAAISTLVQAQGERWLVLGGMRELGGDSAALHAECGAFAAQQGVSRLLVVGAEAQPAAEAFGANARFFANTGELLEWCPQLPAGVTALVKASRGARLEVVVQGWLAGQGGQAC